MAGKRNRKDPSSSGEGSSGSDVESDKENSSPKPRKVKKAKRNWSRKPRRTSNQVTPPTLTPTEIPTQTETEANEPTISEEKIDPACGFDSVGGLDETIAQLRRNIILRMKNKDTFRRDLNVKPIKGMIFHGPPGTGKTLMAKALAAELSRLETKNKFTFYYRKGGDMLSKWVGESEKMMSVLFEKAKSTKPSLIFFDEMDSLFSKRHDFEAGQSQNTIVCSILSQMDTMEGGEVIVIGATNRLDAIDPAFRRPGRFDTDILFTVPNKEGRKNILGVHTKEWSRGRKPSEEFLENVAGQAVGFTGADLKSLCSEALNSATKRLLPDDILAVASDKFVAKELRNLDILEDDWIQALKAVKPTNTNVFGHSSFAGLSVPPLLSLLIKGVQEELIEWVNGFLSEKNGGFHCSYIWANSEEKVEDLDSVIVPSALTQLAQPDRKIVVVDQEFLEIGKLGQIIQTASLSHSSTLLYIPRLDALKDELVNFLAKALRKEKRLRGAKSPFVVIGSGAYGSHDLDDSIKYLITKANRILEVRSPNRNEIIGYFNEKLQVLREGMSKKDFDQQLNILLRVTEGQSLSFIDDLGQELFMEKNPKEIQNILKAYESRKSL